MMKYLIFALFFTFTIIDARITECGDSNLGTLDAVIISDCKKDDPKCFLKRGTNVSIEITFTPKEDLDSLTAVVYGETLGISTRFNLPNDDGCKNSNLACPLKANHQYTYETTLPILSQYPRVTVTVKWELQDKNEKDVVCVLIPSKIK